MYKRQKKRTIFGSTSYNEISRFIKEIPEDLLDGFEQLDASSGDEFGDSGYKWEYGTSSKVKSYKLDGGEYSGGFGVAAKGFSYGGATGTKAGGSGSSTGFQFKTAESFLNSLNNKRVNEGTDITKYKEGQRIYHKNCLLYTSRITDHRIGLSIYQMDDFSNGNLDEMIDNLIAADRAEKLKGDEE